jgi:predicted secreted protein
MFQPLGRLFGAYERVGPTAGILINSNHPVSLQRFTAAHEYGHYVLGHESQLDEEEQIEHSGRTDGEIAAQAFAADFLMPLQLVNLTLRDLGFSIKPAQLSALDVYRLALEFGASYAATINQLVALKKLDHRHALSLRKRQPITIKEELGGFRPRHSWADIWLLDDSQVGRKIAPRLDDEVHVILPETPSTGYLWVWNESKELNGQVGVELIRQLFEAPNVDQSEIVGDAGRRHFVFSVTRLGFHTLKLVMTRPWRSDEVETVFEAHLDAQPRATGASDHGLAEEQKDLLLTATG